MVVKFFRNFSCGSGASWFINANWYGWDVQCWMSCRNLFFDIFGRQFSSAYFSISPRLEGNKISPRTLILTTLGTFLYDCVLNIQDMFRCLHSQHNFFIMLPFKNFRLDNISSKINTIDFVLSIPCLLYTSPSPRD